MEEIKVNEDRNQIKQALIADGFTEEETGKIIIGMQQVRNGEYLSAEEIHRILFADEKVYV